MARQSFKALTLATFLAAACADPGTTITIDAEARSSSDAPTSEVVSEIPAQPDAQLELSPGELIGIPDAEDPDAYTGCEAGQGCFGDPCSSSKDCIEGLCLDHLGGLACSIYCVEDCPAGFSCKQVSLGGPDPVWVCVSDHPRLCRPCNDDEDCGFAGLQGRCIAYGAEGSFCGGNCAAGKLCPAGFACKEVLSREGSTVMQCFADAGVCQCSAVSVELSLSTSCVEANELGSCNGIRVCTENGLSPCDAKVPAAEECNGIDDNCNGETDEDTCGDENPCTVDSCTAGAGCAHAPLDGIPCDDGDSCTLGDTCSAGTCGGETVVCSDGNPCTQDLCDGNSGCKFPGAAGKCEDGDPCTFGDSCSDGACVPGTTLNCDDSNTCTNDSCGGPGGCVHVDAPGSCNDQNMCTFDDKCLGGACVPSGFADCDDLNPCTTDSCDPAKGCHHKPAPLPCDDGDLCTLGDTCVGGECGAGTLLDCNDHNPCTKDACNPLIGCQHTNNSDPCEDLDPCTLTDKCVGGSCVGVGAADCDDANPCTNDFCEPMAGCTHLPGSGSCDDGNPCSWGDACQGGSCIAGKPIGCDDGNVCTNDSCDPASGCTQKPNSKPCDDKNDCTTDDHCQGGTCISSQAAACDDGNPCTTDSCLPQGGCKFTMHTGPCTDGDPCTVGDACSQGSCASGPALACADGNSCTEDSCKNGTCSFVGTQGACDDGNPCTTGDACSGGVCKAGSFLDCDDSDTCTTDYCDPGFGCVHKLNDAPCEDGDKCTSGDTCALGQCTPGPLLVCDDQNSCTKDSCAGGQCQHAPILGACDDGNACTTGETCLNGKCQATQLTDCDDANPCTKDTCTPAAGCQHTAQSGPCNDGNACTLVDACDQGSCVGSVPPDCDDASSCTADTCDAGIGCEHNPQEGPCDDSNACTQTDGCTAGQCAGANPLVCSDGNGCTNDSCNPAVGCVFTPISPCCGNGVKEAGEGCDDGNLNPGDGCNAQCQSELACFGDWLVGTPCNGVDYGNGCVPSDTGYHFKGIFSGYACWWHHKNQAWNTSTNSNFWNLAVHFGVTPGVGKCHWCDNKFSNPNPTGYGSCEGYFSPGQVGAWGWCAEGDPNSVGFVCIPTEGHPACQ